MNSLENIWRTVKPGRKNQSPVSIANTPFEVPMTTIGGAGDGPSVLITTGIHGSEYPATLAAIELARELNPEDVHGRLIMIHPVNTSAFKARASAIVPEDGDNLNRMFPGDPNGGLASRMAWWLTVISDAADFYMDLHSGDIYEELTPYVYFPGHADEKVIEASKAAAMVLDVPFMVRSGAFTGAYNSAAVRGTPAILVERGGAGFCLRNDVDLYKKDIRNVLNHLGLLKSGMEPTASRPVEMTKVIYLESEHDAAWQSEVKLGQKVVKGQNLGRVFDLFGRTLAEYRAETDGTVLYQLYTLSTNKKDVLIAYGA
ncbi:succinylglutamate desuccinylase [Deltaproteobacteria bacterium Smac51]|nr:succinylglutamate desuccinylase [Deltaproteobacteria bacterium Smac51]